MPYRATLICTLMFAGGLHAQSRVMRPEDLFQIQHVEAISWPHQRTRAAVEVRHAERWLGLFPAVGDLRVVEVASASVRTISPSGRAYVGHFAASWSPDGQSLAFLSVDTSAVIRPWIWRVGTTKAVPMRGLQLHEDLADNPTISWTDDRTIVLLVRDTTYRNAGRLYTQILSRPNAAEQQRKARLGEVAAVSVLDSRDSLSAGVHMRLVSVDVASGAITTLATGSLHHPKLSSDRRTITFRRDSLSAMIDPRKFLNYPGSVDDAYVAADVGIETHHVDARTGQVVSAPASPSVTTADTSDAFVHEEEQADGTTRVLLARKGKPEAELWRANAWAREVSRGEVEPITYPSADGGSLTSWLLYPPNGKSRNIPIVMIIYPGQTYGARVPSAFGLLQENFEHPQLFAALGYGVLLASMPVRDEGRQASSFNELTPNLLPLLDTLIARGIADSSRIAVLGQSTGGYAVLGLITQTHRFRSAIASGAYSHIAADYGTFYPEYRDGDAGSVLRAQLLRMLQYERGVFGAPGPPWEHPDWYKENSPLFHASSVRTPTLLIKGESDFVPVQDAEQFFTALYRQGQRVVLLRYAGEGHTIAGRANVLDLWRRLEAWLRETMP